MRVALSGTPGTGKTSVATILMNKGFTVVHLHTFAQENHCIAGRDKKRNTQLIDMRKLEKAILRCFSTDTLVFFDGHIGHLLKSMQKVILLRCHPNELERRLLKKKWVVKKRKENIDAEMVDVILSEAVQHHASKDIFELDTTSKTPEEIAAIIHRFVKKNFQPTKTYRVGQIDWSEEILQRV
ncbi:MAG TPA: adenylate kinase family protein [Candidatus Thermoplasmatota archaeon]|nr:adenylate kinase family protein [Candidatus Thermoplasmatota archaeon]